MINQLESNRKALLHSLDYQALFKREFQSINRRTNKRLKEIEMSLIRISQRKKGLIDMRAEGEVTKVEFQEYIRENEERRNELEKEILNLKRVENLLSLVDKDIESMVLSYLYSDEVLVELIHRFVSGIQVFGCGDVEVSYHFWESKVS
ncbi:hypothetical protein [Alkalihalobacillus pseudalcaliphilus]|uniref:hypothetical protein n=1 Tax=Alkalihalobacillus pseudalcaliphilus TaxID=79884 RepID=UPI00064D8471|nr:hypothetical protein [Alkalihalobacillus pseudalcaliphilus]KMK75271.1 hypothetical protein AB990_17790 [Alkalihalobacillus pseudalcaliphilus]